MNPSGKAVTLKAFKAWALREPTVLVLFTGLGNSIRGLLAQQGISMGGAADGGAANGGAAEGRTADGETAGGEAGSGPLARTGAPSSTAVASSSAGLRNGAGDGMGTFKARKRGVISRLIGRITPRRAPPPNGNQVSL